MPVKIHTYVYIYIYIYNVKYNLCKSKAVPLHAWSGPEGSRKLRFPDFMTTAQDGAKVVSRLYPRKCSWYPFPQGHSAIGRILCQWKIPMIPSRIEPAPFRFVAQHLNHCATTVPHIICTYVYVYTYIYIYFIINYINYVLYIIYILCIVLCVYIYIYIYIYRQWNTSL